MSPLPSDDRRVLLTLARQAITAAVTKQSAPPRTVLSADPGPCGAFVSLHIGGRLRGCIGMIESAGPLADTVARCAVAAAFEDPRFDPVTAAEVQGLEIEVSVLSPLRSARPEEVEPGTHGLRIRMGYASGLLLPQVATRYNWSRERFLEETCHKAGLPPGAWREPDARIEVFTAEVFSESDFSMLDVSSPVLLLLKDEGSFLLFRSTEDLQAWVEPIDIDNEEYLAWDSQGRRLKLRVVEDRAYAARKKVLGFTFMVLNQGTGNEWLELSIQSGPDPELRGRLASFLRGRGKEVSGQEDLPALFEEIPKG